MLSPKKAKQTLDEQIGDCVENAKKSMRSELELMAKDCRDLQQLVEAGRAKNERLQKNFDNLSAKREEYIKKKQEKKKQAEERIAKHFQNMQTEMKTKAAEVMKRDLDALEKLRKKRAMMASNCLEEVDEDMARLKKNKATKKAQQIANLKEKEQKRIQMLQKKEEEQEKKREELAALREKKRIEKKKLLEVKSAKRAKAKAKLEQLEKERMLKLRANLEKKINRSEKAAQVKVNARNLCAWKNSPDSMQMNEFRKGVLKKLKRSNKLQFLEADKIKDMKITELCKFCGINLTDREKMTARKFNL